ncbi:MAG: hypothetical protein HY791_14890 [Deltaproteobacteria bacterium]|nr:hypothetical protein [Deltaproteobacteria bacterium]
MLMSQATPSALSALFERRRASIPAHPFIVDVARALVDAVYEGLEESLVLARAFLTVPYGSLPSRQQSFAAELARTVELLEILTPHTPVHSLVATRGRDPRWNRLDESRGHVAIPLLSEKFVGSIPMMSRLLRDLGLPLSWVQDPGAALERQLLGSEVGCFWIADPRGAVDDLGRKIIPAQEFVTSHGVESVFAVGGVMFGGAVFTLILFAKDRVESRTPRAFMPLISQVKAILVSECSISRVFPLEPLELSHE